MKKTRERIDLLLNEATLEQLCVILQIILGIIK
jgi:hypothetical protein